MLQTHTQYPQKVNVWAGILGSNIIRPFIIDGFLNGEKYLDLLQNHIGPEIEEKSENIETIWYQHDGCPAHCRRSVTEYLDQCYSDSWIGRRGTINWPVRSPGLGPNDFF